MVVGGGGVGGGVGTLLPWRPPHFFCRGRRICIYNIYIFFNKIIYMHTHIYIYVIYIWECNGTYIDHQFRQEFRPFDQALGETGESTELIATLPARCDAAFSAAHSKSLGCGDSW